jgi:hypothetical protein
MDSLYDISNLPPLWRSRGTQNADADGSRSGGVMLSLVEFTIGDNG